MGFPSPPLDAPPQAPTRAPTTTTSEGAEARTLRGHRFITPFLFDGPFITSDIGMTAEIGRQWSPSVPLAGTDTTNNVMQASSYNQQLAAVGQYASLHIAVSDRVAIGVDGSYSALLGGDANSALLFGSKNAWTLQPSAKIRLYSSDATQLGLRIYGDFGSAGQEDPAGILVEIANESRAIGASASRQACLAAGILSCALTDNAAFNAQSTMSSTKSLFGGGVGLSLAHAFGSVFAFQSALSLGVGYSPITVGTSMGANSYASVPVTFQLGIAPSFDFGQSVPLSIMAEYQLTVVDEPGISSATVDAPDEVTVRNSFLLGLYYTGRSNLVAGVRVAATFEQANASIDSSDSMGNVSTATGEQPLVRVTGQVTARYYF